MWAPAIAGGIASLAGGYMANRARKQESQRNRQFQERMRNTAWQAAVSDMKAAGINPALAYSRGPAASPGGSMAQQSDIVSPAVSSAKDLKRTGEELRQIRATTRRLEGEADIAQAKGELEQFRTRYMKMVRGVDTTGMSGTEIEELMPIMRMLKAEVGGAEAGVARTRAQADVMQPMADIANRLGELLPVLMLLSQLSPGGLLKRGAVRRGAKIPKRLSKGVRR